MITFWLVPGVNEHSDQQAATSDEAGKEEEMVTWKNQLKDSMLVGNQDPWVRGEREKEGGEQN